MRIVGIVVALVLLSAAASSSNGKSAVTAGRKVSSEAAATSKGVPGGWEGGETIETAVVVTLQPVPEISDLPSGKAILRFKKSSGGDAEVEVVVPFGVQTVVTRKEIDLDQDLAV